MLIICLQYSINNENNKEIHYLLVSLIFLWIREIILKHALKDLNPRHQVLETYVLPTELRALLSYLVIV